MPGEQQARLGSGLCAKHAPCLSSSADRAETRAQEQRQGLEHAGRVLSTWQVSSPPPPCGRRPCHCPRTPEAQEVSKLVVETDLNPAGCLLLT